MDPCDKHRDYGEHIPPSFLPANSNGEVGRAHLVPIIYAASGRSDKMTWSVSAISDAIR